MRHTGMGKYGIMIMSGFAALWVFWGLSAFRDVPLPAVLAPVLLSGGLIWMASRMPVHADVEARRRVGRVVGWVSAGEGIAIFVAANILAWCGWSAWFPSVTAAIVGLHFFPLARLLGVRLYDASGAAIVAVGVISGIMPDVHARLMVAGFGAAAILYATCLSVLGRARVVRA